MLGLVDPIKQHLINETYNVRQNFVCLLNNEFSVPLSRFAKWFWNIPQAQPSDFVAGF